MKYNKLTSKFQTTIPKEVREKLKLGAGDMVAFEIDQDGNVMVRKVYSVDQEYLRSVEKTLSEWNSKEDDEAFEHLQSL